MSEPFGRPLCWGVLAIPTEVCHCVYYDGSNHNCYTGVVLLPLICRAYMCGRVPPPIQPNHQRNYRQVAFATQCRTVRVEVQYVVPYEAGLDGEGET